MSDWRPEERPLHQMLLGPGFCERLGREEREQGARGSGLTVHRVQEMALPHQERQRKSLQQYERMLRIAAVLADCR
ncbi:hypothetical protein NDU88_005119 [Pleurodeles waltl]|uniref:Uncharacterized protein n=1 Tax=Pleurodeles waltl TaxID=8319 RepID=A0AAV7L1U0_PLEWA|nr:hypothetical protein NDU88_005119 [Pleurodeles waltl]